MARGMPMQASRVRSMSSPRDWVSTEMVTSSGIAPSSTRERTKSKSVWEAAGKPISISLKPMLTSRSKMARLAWGPMGSMRDWLPSRRSVLSQRGAAVMRLSGQVRSGRSMETTSRNGRYLANGIPEGCWGAGRALRIGFLLGSDASWFRRRFRQRLRSSEGIRGHDQGRGRAGRVSRGRGAGLSGPAAATKQEAHLVAWSRSHAVDPTPMRTHRQVRGSHGTAE